MEDEAAPKREQFLHLPVYRSMVTWQGLTAHEQGSQHRAGRGNVRSDVQSMNPAQPSETAAGPKRDGASIRGKVNSTRDIKQLLKGLITKCT